MPNTPWIDGKSLPFNELCGRFNLPKDEAQSFLSCARIYPRGADIITEGDDDRILFVLRHGEVDVYKHVTAAERKHIAVIEALNIFGEMSLLNDEPRNATIVARSDEVLVYAVGRPNLSVMLANPRWAEILVTRLSRNLAQANARLVDAAQNLQDEAERRRQLAQQMEQLQQERVQQMVGVSQALALLIKFQEKIQEHAVVGSRGWAYLRGLNRVTHQLIQTYIPALAGRLPRLDEALLEPYLKTVFGTRELNPPNSDEPPGGAAGPADRQADR